jgi:hypothetical protein
MPAAPSSLTDPAIGQLLTAAQPLDCDRVRLLVVLAAIPDPAGPRRGSAPAGVILSLLGVSGVPVVLGKFWSDIPDVR